MVTIIVVGISDHFKYVKMFVLPKNSSLNLLINFKLLIYLFLNFGLIFMVANTLCGLLSWMFIKDRANTFMRFFKLVLNIHINIF